MNRAETTSRSMSAAALLRAVTACLLLSAAVIHVLEVPEHFEDDLLYRWFFVAMATAQAAAAVAVIFWRRRLILFGIALGNLIILSVGALTRTVGIPMGAQRGVREAVGRPDLAAVLLEIASVVIVLYLLFTLGDAVRMPYRWAVPFGIAALTFSGASIVASVAGDREACSHFNPEYGPLATVNGHSLLPPDHPKARLGTGQIKSLISGFLVNCSNDKLMVTGVEVISDAGEAAQVLGTSVLSIGQESEPKRHRTGIVAVPPTSDRPELALFSEVKGVSEDPYFINGPRISYRYGGGGLSQVFATNVGVDVGGAE